MTSYDAAPKERSSNFGKWPTTALLSTILVAGALALVAGPLAEDAHAGDKDDHDDDVIPLTVTEIYFELNNTDGDLGIHALIDGDAWKKLEMESPNGRELLEIAVKSRLRRQGLTELFFESAEPTFDELPPEVFFARFPEGVYGVEGKTLDGDELEGEADVTHLMPAPPEIEVNGEALPEDCDLDSGPVVSEPLTITWDPITRSHPDLGRTDEEIEVTTYQVVVEQEESTVKTTFDVPPEVTELNFPTGLLDSGEVKIEVLVREASHNQTATESCFEID